MNKPISYVYTDRKVGIGVLGPVAGLKTGERNMWRSPEMITPDTHHF